MCSVPGEAEAMGPVSSRTDAGRTFAEIAAEVGIGDVQREGAGKRQKAKTLPGVRTVLFAILLLALLCVGGYLYWSNYMGAGDRWLRIGRLEGQEVAVHDGKVFLVTGVIANGSTKGRKSIVLRVKLFDGQGRVIKEKDSLAGMLLSRQQIAALQKSDVEKRVAAFKLSPPETFRVEAGREIPFSVPFCEDDLGKVKEFAVQIIQSNFL